MARTAQWVLLIGITAMWAASAVVALIGAVMAWKGRRTVSIQFRKKPVVIEAVQYAGKGNMNPRGGLPDWLWDALKNGTAYFSNGADPLCIRTLEGVLTVAPGDWIIRGVKGELYPCKPDIFAASYEPVTGDSRQ